MNDDGREVIWLENLGRQDVPVVGGKNASLGEMVGNLRGKGISVPAGFATTADAYWRFVEANGLRETTAGTLGDMNIGKIPLAECFRGIPQSATRRLRNEKGCLHLLFKQAAKTDGGLRKRTRLVSLASLSGREVSESNNRKHPFG